MGQSEEGADWLGRTLGNRPFLVAALYLVSFLMPFMVLIAVALAYVFRREHAEEWEASHYRYLLRTFWLAFGLTCLFAAVGLGVLALVERPEDIALGVLLVVLVAIGLALVQFGVRSVLSISRATARQPMPRPDSLAF